MANNEIKAKFKADTAGFDSAISASNSELQSLRAELKLNEAQFRNTGDSSEYLSKKGELLQSQLDANAQKQEALNQKIEVATNLYGADSAEVAKLQDSLTYAKIQEENIKSAIDGTNSSLDGQSNASQSAADGISQISDIEAAQFLQDFSGKVIDTAGALWDAANAASDYTDNIDKMSQRLGMSRDAYQEWDYVLSQSGVEIDSIKTGYKTLTNTIGKVTEANDTAGTAFEKLGFGIEDIKGKTQEDIFAQTVFSLQAIKDPAEKATIAQQLFGRSGQEMIPLLNQSAESTQALIDKAHEYGLVLDNEAIEQGVEFHDTIDTLNRSLDNVKNTFAASLQPAIQGVVEVVGPLAAKAVEVGDRFDKFVAGSPAAQAAITGISTALLVLAGALGIATIIKSVQTAMGLLNATMLANPAVWIAAAIIGVGAALIYAYKHSKTFRDVVSGAFNAVKGKVSMLVNAFNTIKTTVTDVVGKAIDKFNNMKEKISNVVDKIKGFFPISIKKLLSNIELPHFKITGSFSIKNRTVPKLSYEWYDKAMKQPRILTGAQIFGVSNSGRYLGGGESGPEMIGGVNTVADMITYAVERGNTGVDLDTLARKFAEACASINTTVSIGRREFGRLVKEV